MEARARETLTKALPGLVALYLFGSRASGQQGPQSDVDLAILAREPVIATWLYETARGLEVDLGVDVDLVDLLTASTVLKKEVIEHGALIYCADPDATLDFEASSLSEYGRYREGIEPILRAVRESGRAYGP